MHLHTHRPLLRAGAMLLALLWSALTLADTESPLAQALQWQQEADSLMRGHSYTAAAQLYARTIPVFESQNLLKEAAVLRHQAGFSLVGAGNYRAAIPYFEANLAYHRSRNDAEGEGNYMLYLAQAYAALAEHNRALDLLRDARNLFPAAHERRAEIDHWRVLSLEYLGRIREAGTVLEEASRSTPPEAWQTYLAADQQRLIGQMAHDTPQAAMNQAAPWLGAILVTVVLVWAGRRSRPLRKLLVNVTLIAASAGIAIGATEALLRAADPAAENVRHFLHPPNQRVRFVPERDVMPGVHYDKTRFTTNEAGLRADPLPPPGVMRILAVGGSSTEALFLDDADAWPQRLQEVLRATGREAWVGNAGKSGLSSVSHVVQMYFHLREFRPDVVLLTAGINDLNQCVSGGLQAVLDNAQLVRNADFVMQYRRYVFDHIVYEQTPERWRLMELWQRAQAQLNPGNEAVTERFHYVIQDKAGIFYKEQRRRRQVAEQIAAHPNIQPCLTAFEDNLRRIAHMAREHNARLVLATQGSLYRHDLSTDEDALLWFGAVDANPFAAEAPRVYYTAGAMAEMLSMFNTVTQEVCSSEGLVCLDTDSVLPKTTASYYDDVHLNVGGSHALANAFARLLVDNGLVDPTF